VYQPSTNITYHNAIVLCGPRKKILDIGSLGRPGKKHVHKEEEAMEHTAKTV
jgi:hypothetical protein